MIHIARPGSMRAFCGVSVLHVNHPDDEDCAECKRLYRDYVAAAERDDTPAHELKS